MATLEEFHASMMPTLERIQANVAPKLSIRALSSK